MDRWPTLADESARAALSEKSMRDRLIRLAARHPTWALEGDGVRLVEQAVAKDDPDPKALACYGLLLRADPTDEDAADRMWLRFADGRPVSPVIIDYLDWCCRKLHAEGKEALLLIWDNAPWHVSQQVRTWLRT